MILLLVYIKSFENHSKYHPDLVAGAFIGWNSGNAVDDELAKLKGKKATGRGNSMEVGHGAIKIAGL